MFKVERKLLDFCEKHLDFFAIGAITLLSMLIRYYLRNLSNADVVVYFLPWYEEFKSGSGLKALGQQVGDYNIPYQTLISLLTYLPIKNPLHAYKILAIFFDYCMAIVAGWMVYCHSQGKDRKWKGIFAYSAVIMSPLVILNSAAWAQCDSIYVCFVLLALVMLCREKYVPSFLFLGAALSFKLQAVFILPLFLFVYFWRKRFSILYFLMVPAMMCVLSFLGVLMGRRFLDIFTIYFDQTNEYTAMVVNYPSTWLFLTENYRDNDYYLELEKVGILLTVAVLLLIMIILIWKKAEWNPRNLIYIAFLLSYTCIMFLPAMHERYGYLYEILAIVIFIWKKETVVFLVPMYCMTIMTYASFLFGTSTRASMGMAAVNLIIYLGYLFLLMKDMTTEQKSLQ